MLSVTCECGWTSIGQRDALIEAVRDHSRRHHHDVEPSEDEILAVAVPVSAPTTGDRHAARNADAGHES